MFPLPVEPAVTVYPAKTRPLRQHNLLVCSVNGFYPGHVEIMVMLEVVPQGGEVYACHVEHPSLMNPITVEWRAQDKSSQEKMLSGIGACVLGLLFLGMGLLFYIRSQDLVKPQGPQIVSSFSAFTRFVSLPSYFPSTRTAELPLILSLRFRIPIS
nr:DLA class II histocompatibility antigen, DR-1 beta chain-like isoform X4 [Odocoileus virginianus texanus]